MRKSCRVQVNDQGFTAQRGELLLDAALGNGIDMPHDCRAGQCGSCKVKVLSGMTVGGDGEELGMVKACQARIITDLEIMVESVPEVLTTRGTVMKLRPLAPDVMEVQIRPSQEISYLPGQYYRFQFKGFPGRYFSPTAPMDQAFDGKSLRLHVRRIPDGRVSPALGQEIQAGHPVTLTGPFGHAFFRPGLDNRLILIGSGTGFAPIWSIAEAAIDENPNREMVVLAAGKTMASLYMAPAFRRLRNYPNVKLIPCVSDKPPNVARIVRKGRPTEHMPQLTPDDIVYACGAPQMVDAVKDMVISAGATFYADPFTPPHGSHDDEGIVARAIAWLSTIVPVPGWVGGEQVRALPKPDRPVEPEDSDDIPSFFRQQPDYAAAREYARQQNYAPPPPRPAPAPRPAPQPAYAPPPPRPTPAAPQNYAPPPARPPLAPAQAYAPPPPRPAFASGQAYTPPPPRPAPAPGQSYAPPPPRPAPAPGQSYAPPPPRPAPAPGQNYAPPRPAAAPNHAPPPRRPPPGPAQNSAPQPSSSAPAPTRDYPAGPWSGAAAAPRPAPVAARPAPAPQRPPQAPAVAPQRPAPASRPAPARPLPEEAQRQQPPVGALRRRMPPQSYYNGVPAE